MVSLLAGKTGRAPRANAPRTVDVLTTYCADEPSEMVVNTLHAIQRIRYPHNYLPLRRGRRCVSAGVCDDLGVIHVTRRDKTDAKAGNINNALRQATVDPKIRGVIFADPADWQTHRADFLTAQAE